MPRDDGGTPEKAVAAATKAISDGAEVIVGPLFAPGSARVPADVALYIGKAVCVL